VVAIDSILSLNPPLFRARLVDGIVEHGYAIFPELIRMETAETIRAEMSAFRSAEKFSPASIGKGAQLAPETRGDGTTWLEPAELTPAQVPIATVLSFVKEALNEGLFLGLWDWEGHYAIYPPGTFYRTHLDRFQNDSKRTISVVLFFNPSWTDGDGGALRLETSAGEIRVAPTLGTAVFFRSDRIPHEVLETHRERYSFAGWLRTRA